MVSETQAPFYRPRIDWPARSIIAGFSASVVMSIAFFVAYGLARVIAGVELANRRGAAEFRDWMYALTHNQAIDLASGSLYTAGAVHLAIGVIWAVLYAYYVEPRLIGPGWFRGTLFSLFPWVLSVAVFFPLIGGGLFGFALGAGPLPAFGNLVLHVIYGASLGAMYGEVGDIPADDFSFQGERDDLRAMAGYEGATAKGIGLGVVAGLIVGGVVAVIAEQSPGLDVAIPPIAFVLVTGVLGATFGGVVGSLAGLSPARRS